MPKLNSTQAKVTYIIELTEDELNRYLLYIKRLIQTEITHEFNTAQLISDAEELDNIASEANARLFPMNSTLSQSQRKDRRAT